MIMSRAFLALLLVSTTALPAQASPPAPKQVSCGCVATVPETPVDPENLALARTLVETISPRQDSMGEFNNTVRRMTQVDLIADKGLRGTVQTELESLLVKMGPVIERHADRLQEVAAMAYARKFTPAELRATTTFASTPEGRNVLTRIFEIPYDPAMLREQGLLMAELGPDISQFQVAVCKRQTAARIAAGEKTAKCSLA
jgi:hypothetical protein